MGGGAPAASRIARAEPPLREASGSRQLGTARLQPKPGDWQRIAHHQTPPIPRAAAGHARTPNLHSALALSPTAAGLVVNGLVDFLPRCVKYLSLAG